MSRIKFPRFLAVLAFIALFCLVSVGAYAQAAPGPSAPPGFQLPALNLWPIAQQVLTSLVASGAVGWVLSFLLKQALAQHGEFKPVVQKADNYLQWAEIQAIHIAELAGVNTGIGSAAKMKLAVDYVLDIAKDAGIQGDATAVTADSVKEDIEALIPQVYKGHGQAPSK